MHKAPFCTKNNSRENRFFAATHPLDDKKGTHNVKNSTKNITSLHPHTTAHALHYRPTTNLSQVWQSVHAHDVWR